MSGKIGLQVDLISAGCVLHFEKIIITAVQCTPKMCWKILKGFGKKTREINEFDGFPPFF